VLVGLSFYCLFILTQKKLVAFNHKLRLYGNRDQGNSITATACGGWDLRINDSFDKEIQHNKEHNGSERCDNEFVFFSLFHNFRSNLSY